MSDTFILSLDAGERQDALQERQSLQDCRFADSLASQLGLECLDHFTFHATLMRGRIAVVR